MPESCLPATYTAPPGAMRIPAYVWQLNRDYPGAEPDDANLPLSEVWLKTHDGVTWMGNIYRHPAAPLSGASVTHLTQVYAQNNIRFVPWCVPTGEDIPREAEIATEVLDGLAAAGAPLRLALDIEVENTPNFWKGTPAQLAELVDRIRQAYSSAELTLVLYQDVAIGLNTIGPLFDVFSTMDYWNDFGTQPEVQLRGSLQRLAPFARPIIYGLPGNAPQVELVRALNWVETNGGGKAVLWRRGTTSHDNWDLVASY